MFSPHTYEMSPECTPVTVDLVHNLGGGLPGGSAGVDIVPLHVVAIAVGVGAVALRVSGVQGGGQGGQ